MNNKIMGVIIGASIAVMMIASVMVPIINDAVDDTKVYYNNDFGVLSAAASESIEYTIEDTGNTSGHTATCYINGVESAKVYQGLRGIVISDSYTILQENSGNSFSIAVGKSIESAIYTAIKSEGVQIELTRDHATISFVTSDGPTSVDVDSEWSYYRDDNSDDYRVVDYQSTSHRAYVNNPSQVKGSFWTNATNSFIVYDGNTATSYGNNPQTVPVTLSDYRQEMNGVYSFEISEIVGGSRTEGAQFTMTVNDAPVTISPYLLVIPNEVYGQTETDIAYTSILYAIPAILIVALLLVITSVFRRD